MEEVWLVCEGTSDSVDAAVLTSIFTRVLAAGIIVEPSGSSSPGAAAAFLQGRNRGGRAASVIDRDYKRRDQAEESFRDGTNSFIWRRHCIENYLLSPAVIARAFDLLRERFTNQFSGPGLPPWVTALPTDPERVADILRECAQRRAAEEACHMTVHRLWDDLSDTAGRVQKRVPTLDSGHPPDDLEGWRAALRVETERLREAARKTMDSAHLGQDAVVRRFDEIHGGVISSAYLADLEFLLDFNGKELLQQFVRSLEASGIRLSFARLRKELVDVVADVYASDRTIYRTDDFRDLANGARTMAGLSALP